MAVYVDQSIHNYGRMTMCHMVADTLDELHSMADAIGVQRKWFQNRRNFPHYDICKSKRAKAIECGAVSMTSKELVKKANMGEIPSCTPSPFWKKFYERNKGAENG